MKFLKRIFHNETLNLALSGLALMGMGIMLYLFPTVCGEWWALTLVCVWTLVTFTLIGSGARTNQDDDDDEEE